MPPAPPASSRACEISGRRHSAPSGSAISWKHAAASAGGPRRAGNCTIRITRTRGGTGRTSKDPARTPVLARSIRRPSSRMWPAATIACAVARVRVSRRYQSSLSSRREAVGGLSAAPALRLVIRISACGQTGRRARQRGCSPDRSACPSHRHPGAPDASTVCACRAQVAPPGARRRGRAISSADRAPDRHLLVRAMSESGNPAAAGWPDGPPVVGRSTGRARDRSGS